MESELDLLELSIQYRDFALWQNQYLSGHRLETQLAYWKNKLEGYETLNLATDKPRANKIDYYGSNIYFELDEDISRDLKDLAKELKVSLYSLLLAGYFLMLRVYTNQDDIVVGSSVANRHYNQVENLIGFFVNSLPLRVQINPNEYVTEFIKQIGKEVVVAQKYQDLPFEKLVEELDITKDTSRHPIFQVMFGMQQFGNIEQNHILQLYTGSESLYDIAKFDISTFIDDRTVKLQGYFNYRVSLFTDRTIANLIETYVQILKQFSTLAHNSYAQQRTKLLNINYLNAEKYKQLIFDYNQTDKAYPSNQTIQKLFEAQAVKAPKNIALIYKEQQLTYEQLNEQANRLANYLRENFKILPHTLIALCLDRSEHMIVAILAILKAGAAYVPIDMSYPNERIGYILEDTGTSIVLTNEFHKDRLEEIKNTYKKDLASLIDRKPNGKAAIFVIDNQIIQEKIRTQSATNPTIQKSSADLAYVIYTSGTTGNPKGVMIAHENVANYIFNVKAHISLSFEDVVDFSASIGFDLAVTTTIGSLCLGAKIAVYEHQLQDLESYKNHLISSNINVIKLVPSYFELLINILPDTKVNKVIVGGEKLNHNIINKLDEVYDNINSNLKIYDEYGPTEATVGACNNQVYPSNSLSIGKPYANYRTYILSPELIPLPVGAIGELYLGGIGLARGYLNQPGLTSERFIANPFRSKEERKLGRNARLYKTGDLVKWLPDGNLEYIGRNDFQVKIKGYRIELGEIESAILQHKNVHQAVVVEQKIAGLTYNSRLVAYVVPGDFTPTIVELKNFLSARLPEYMVPSMFIYLEKLPITINGKLDRKALPNPEAENIYNYTAPKNEIEIQLCRIWAEVLGLPIEQIGINNDFFRLGGNSILAIKLISKLNNYYKAHLKVVDIFVCKDIELLAPRIFQTKDRYQPIIKLNNTCEKPNMFMIHPGAAGCEVYASLANKLADHFSCYGIDSYNLHNEVKIDNLHILAKYYLSYIEKIMADRAEEEYHLLGWSLGGQISLEIASILEQQKTPNIRVYLLDSLLYDDYLTSFKYGTYSDQLLRLEDEYRSYATAQGYDKLYIEKVIPNIEIEYKLQHQKISIALNNTQVLLFKAMLKNNINLQDNYSNELAKYIFALKYNNVEKAFRNKPSIKLIEVNNANHSNILKQEDFLKFHIIDCGKSQK